jgi:hypothetical protein
MQDSIKLTVADINFMLADQISKTPPLVKRKVRTGVRKLVHRQKPVQGTQDQCDWPGCSSYFVKGTRKRHYRNCHKDVTDSLYKSRQKALKVGGTPPTTEEAKDE